MLPLKFFLIVYFISTALLYAQINLVPNPSFEDTVMCPDAGAQVDRARHWYIAEQTPDYFNSCCIYPQLSVPDNFCDFQYAASGNAYCGFCAYTSVDTNYREKIGVQLINSLNIGTRYYISIKISATKKYTNGASNKIGTLFSMNQYTDSYRSPNLNTCQFWSDAIVTDTINWTLLKGSFIADSAYRYLSIGNFFSYLLTDTLSLWNTNALQSYYFIDDICVSSDSIVCFEENYTSINHIISPSIILYPNPATDIINISFADFRMTSIQIINIDNKVVYQVINNLNSVISLNISNYLSGIYYIKIITRDNTYYKSFIKY